MTVVSSYAEPAISKSHEHRRALDVLRALPDRCVANIEELARRIGAEKLALIGWLRADLQLARLAAKKVRQ